MATKQNYTPYYILAAAAAAAFYFRKDIKNLFSKDEEIEPGQNPDGTPLVAPTVPQKVVTTNGVETIAAPVTKKLSPLGTPKSKLNFNIYLKNGDKGQEVAKLQQILNAMSNITGKPKIQEDGNFGPGTEARLSSTFGNIDKINLFKMYAALFAVFAAKKVDKLKNWFELYKPLLTDKERYSNARKLYFNYNKDI